MNPRAGAVFVYISVEDDTKMRIDLIEFFIFEHGAASVTSPSVSLLWGGFKRPTQ